MGPGQSRQMNGTWQHDRFQGTGRPGLTTTGPGKLMVSNLDFGVSENDIQELFQEFGKLVSEFSQKSICCSLINQNWGLGSFVGLHEFSSIVGFSSFHGAQITFKGLISPWYLSRITDWCK